MHKTTEIMKILDQKTGGNTVVLNGLYKTVMKQIRKICRTDEEYAEKCEEFLNNACKAVGEEHREFYREYMRKMASERQ